MSNWKRRYVVITDRVLLYAAGNPLLNEEKANVKCVFKLHDITSDETVDLQPLMGGLHSAPAWFVH